MRCSKCKYISFDHNENCPKCKKDLTEIRAKMNLPSYCPILPTQTNFQDQGTAGSIKIEQTGDFESEENMDIQFTDSQDFESSFDSSAKVEEEESDLDFELATDTDELTLDFDEFSLDDDSDAADMEPEQETISAGSLEDELNLSFADDTSDITMNFDEISDDDSDLDDSQSEMETIAADTLEDELNLSFADDTSDMTMDFDETASDDGGKTTMDFEEHIDEDSDSVQSIADSIELTEKEVSEITMDFEDSISADDEAQKLEVLDLDLDISDDNSA
jgi:hypothetical protein